MITVHLSIVEDCSVLLTYMKLAFFASTGTYRENYSSRKSTYSSKLIQHNNRPSVPLGGAGLGSDVCCTDTPVDDMVVFVEDDEAEEEEPWVLEECSLEGGMGLVCEVWRLNVSPRSVSQLVVSVNTCFPPPP